MKAFLWQLYVDYIRPFNPNRPHAQIPHIVDRVATVEELIARR